MNDASFQARRVIEALRTGVPTHDAVRMLGAGQPDLERKADQLFKDIQGGRTRDAAGFIFNGGFGSGKSHLLEALACKALEQGFVVSRTVISRNLPLQSPLPILFDLLSNTESRAHQEDALVNMMSDARFDLRSDLSGLRKWARKETDEGRLAPFFLASLNALRQVKYGASDSDFHTIIEYWSGSSVPVSELNQLFRRCAPHITDRKPPLAAERPRQTVRFLAQLFLELGHSGWIILFDELELIRLHGPVARGKAYAEIGRWFALGEAAPIRGLGAIGSITPDFVYAYIDPTTPSGQADAAKVPTKMSLSVANVALAQSAIDGMKFIVSEQENVCERPDNERLVAIQMLIRDRYEQAYRCPTPSLPIETQAASELKSIRTQIRRWITLWDLHRQGRLDQVEVGIVAPNPEDALEEDT